MTVFYIMINISVNPAKFVKRKDIPMKSSMRKWTSLLAILLVLCLGLSACSSEKEAPPATETPESDTETETPEEGEGEAAAGVLRVGMECAYAPFNWTELDDSKGGVAIDGGGFAGGYDVEIAKRIAASMGRDLVIVKTEWDGLLPSLTSGKIDLIIAGMSPSDARRESIDFSDYYYTSDIVLVVRKDSAFAEAASINDFVGAKVTGQLGTLHYDFIDQMEGVDKQPSMDDFPTMVVALASGKIDAYTSERPGAESAAAANPELTYLVFEGDSGFQYSPDEVSVSVGIAKDSDLLEQVNAALAEISGEARQQLMDQALENQPTAE